MRYFKDRFHAGDMIADKLVPKYRYDDCVVLALGDGSVVVGSAIAKRLHCMINMLVLSGIQLPRELEDVMSINNFGGVTYNTKFSPGELEAIKSEYFSYLEQQKLQKLFEMNELVGQGGIIDKEHLRNKVVVVVSDGLTNGFSMHAAMEFLKPIKVKRVVMATPFANVSAVSHMHMMADEMVCLTVNDEIISIDHYYDDSIIPPHDVIVKTIEGIISQWS